MKIVYKWLRMAMSYKKHGEVIDIVSNSLKNGIIVSVLIRSRL